VKAIVVPSGEKRGEAVDVRIVVRLLEERRLAAQVEQVDLVIARSVRRPDDPACEAPRGLCKRDPFGLADAWPCFFGGTSR